MKVETVEKTDFQPIELKITIETPQELCDLWHRANESLSNINENISDDLKYEAMGGSVFFDLLDELVEKNNLYK